MDGIRMVSGIVVGFIGIDLETDPRYIPSHVRAVLNGYDIVRQIDVMSCVLVFSFDV